MNNSPSYSSPSNNNAIHHNMAQLPPAPQQSPNGSHSPCNPNKKKYVCATCDRGFTTSGHLARHTRVHTGERNHKCPFPGCETRCSRQDNLQQHYRIHLSPGSRRTSASATRAAMNRAMGASGGLSKATPRDGQRRRGKSSVSSPVDLFPENSSSPPIHPPPLAPAHLSVGLPVPEPPNTPPPLAEARLPMYPTHTANNPLSYFSSAPLNHHSHPGSPAMLNSTLNPVSSQWGNFRGHSLPEHEPRSVASQSPVYDYGDVEQAPSPASSASSQQHPQTPSYPFSGHYAVEDRGATCNPHTGKSSAGSSVYGQDDGIHSLGPLPFNSNSRHSIAHISHPNHSPSSVHSLSPSPSHPPTPNFQTSSSYNGNELDAPTSSSLASQHAPGSVLDNAYGTSGLSDAAFTNSPTSFDSQGLPLPDYSTPPSPTQQQFNTYPQSASVNGQYTTHSRYPSPPVVLAPIQNDRLRDLGHNIRRRQSSSDSILHSTSQHLSFPRAHTLPQPGIPSSNSPPPGASSYVHSQASFMQGYPSLGGNHYGMDECRMGSARYRGELVQ
ncbi:hypothetical protein NLI96_g2789 [Meripilus lineatus]|uniref:C2H2-type domain-containing protein n=1 Tax=Meripilus lineatus TaxID=2056292 RepID=A0AAD5YGA2_9APHY|nr:hypothetical protein NLI96_g2789 [Physisporinus lineatus]